MSDVAGALAGEEPPVAKREWAALRARADKAEAERDEARAEVERLESRVRKLESDLAPLVVLAAEVNAIRNSIVGTQSLNWSEHAYPLVAALQKAGVSGLPYPEARPRMATLIERAEKAEAEVERLRAVHLRGCECTTDEARAFARERDEARAEVERLRAEVRDWSIAASMEPERRSAALESLRERCAAEAMKVGPCDTLASRILALPLEDGP